MVSSIERLEASAASIKRVHEAALAKLSEIPRVEKALRRDARRKRPAFCYIFKNGLHPFISNFRRSLDVPVRIGFVNLFAFRRGFGLGALFNRRQGELLIRLEPVDTFDKGLRETASKLRKVNRMFDVTSGFPSTPVHTAKAVQTFSESTEG